MGRALTSLVMGILGAVVCGRPSVADEAACSSITSDSFLTPFVRNVVAYYMTGFLTPENARQAWKERQTIKADELGLPEKVLSLFPKEASDLDTLRRLKEADASELYNTHRLTRHPAFIFPLTRDEFRAEYRYDLAKYESAEPMKWIWDTEKKWRRRIFPTSLVKGKMRVLYRQAGRDFSVAVTHGENGAMLDTEIALKREDDSGNWDFYAYGSDGTLAIRSVFATMPGKENEGPAPYSCLACHYNPQSQTFQRLPSIFNKSLNPGMMLIDGRL